MGLLYKWQTLNTFYNITTDTNKILQRIWYHAIYLSELSIIALQLQSVNELDATLYVDKL